MQKDGPCFGKRVGGALYVHRSALDRLPSEQASLIDAAAVLVTQGNWNVAKIDLAEGHSVSLLGYEDFENSAFPALFESYRVNLKTCVVTVRRYGKNRPILHRKELLLPPDALERDSYVALTRELERRGLFVDMAKRGRQNAWKAALVEARIEVRDHRVFPLDGHLGNATMLDTSKAPTIDAMPPIARHRTAIGRNSLSAPMAALNAAGLLEDGVSVLDYGCGRGDDVRALRAAGIDAVGWDPYFAPDRSALAPRKVVNLGFVLNVVEDPTERRDVLRRAFDLAEQCLAVSVMLVGKGDVSGQRPHGDGFLTSRGTFQRYYMQAELRAFLVDTLDVTPVAAGPGIFFLFRDEEIEQRVLSRRQIGMVAPRPILSVPRPPSGLASGTSWRHQAFEAVQDEFVDLLLTMGRIPHADEISQELLSRLASARLSVKAVLANALAVIPPEEMAASASRQIDEIGRFFALSLFSRRAPYRRLSSALQRDVRAFFGHLSAAEDIGRRMLFDAGDAEGIAKEVESAAAAGLGHFADGKYQIHAWDLPKLTPRLRTYIGIAQTLAGSLDQTTIYRIHIESRKLTALVYADFNSSPLPRLSVRTKVDLRTGEVEVFDHQSAGRVSILLGKSHYMSRDDERYGVQAKFDDSLRSAIGDRLSKLPFVEVASMMIKAGLKPPY